MQNQATLGDYWTALYSRKWVILAVALSSMGLSIWLSHYLPPVFEAKASFYVPSNAQPPLFTGVAPQKQAQAILKPVPDEREAGIVVGVLKSQDVHARVRERFPGRDASFFAKNVDFSTSPQFFTDIYVRDRDPRFAAAVANAYVDAYREFHTDKLRLGARQSVTILEGQIASLSDRLAKKTATIRGFQLQNQVVSEAETEQRYVAQVRAVERQLDEVVVEVQTARARLGLSARGGAGEGERPQSGEGVVAMPGFENLRRLEARQSALNRQLEALRQGSRGSISKMAELQALNYDRKMLQDMLASVESNLTEARVQSVAAQAQIVVVQTAQPPKQPGFPIAGLNGFVGLILGFAAGCYNALLLEYLRRLKLERVRRNLDDSLLYEVSR